MNIFVAGAGGIGSYTVQFLNKLVEHNQLTKVDNIFCYDFDKVEKKNIPYQNFDTGDINSYKTDALMWRYFKIKYITKAFDPYKEKINQDDLIVLAVDNNVVRKQVFEYCITNGIKFIDGRCSGGVIGLFSSDSKDYLSTLSESTGSSSCQFPYAVSLNEFDNGNIIIAAILSQKILQYYRSGILPDDFMYSF